VLYRASDNGQRKADVAARAAKGLYPSMKAQPFVGNVVYDLGLGAFRWADLVLGGLDNREARLSINRGCFKLNRPWIDGAIEQIQGTARVFQPGGACYECTMGETDWKLLQARRSCNLLSRRQMEEGKVPTTPTIASLIAAVQCQEAIKLLHGMEAMAGKGWVFAGLSNDSYQVEFQRKPECYSHESLEEIIVLDGGAETLSAGALLEEARRHLGPGAQLELPREVLRGLICPECGREEEMFASLGRVSESQGRCPHCQAPHRRLETFYRIDGTEAFIDRPLAQIGVPAWDILTARAGGRAIGLELGGDAAAVLGELWEPEIELE
jgi:adenylyltransferase/sulfurtransferase